MLIDTPANLVTIFLSSTSHVGGKPLYSAILQMCEEHGIGGATVTRCDEGYGAHGHHTTRFLALSEDLPLRIDIVDVSERIQPLLVALEPLMTVGGVVIVQDVRMRKFVAETP